MAGMISSVRTITTKKGEPMAFVQLEDLQGQCEVVFFPRTFAEARDKLAVDSVVVIKGKAQSREGQTSLLADSVQNYVEQHFGVENGDEPYQKRLIDLAPTVNGLSALAEEADKDDLVIDEDGVPAPAEENPFRAEMPAWMLDGTAAADANGSSQPAEVASGRQAVAVPGQPPQPKPAQPAAEVVAVPRVATRTSPAAEAATAPHAPIAAEEAMPARAAVLPEPPAASAAPQAVPSPAATGNGPQPPRPQNGGRGQPPDGQRRRLYITFRRSGDLDRDKYRLKEIYDRVRDPYGRDRFYILLEAGGKRYELAFPNDACSISDRLTNELVKHFRTEVTVQEGEARA
jgi:DNA polymerase-3 subunit alpha